MTHGLFWWWIFLMFVFIFPPVFFERAPTVQGVPAAMVTSSLHMTFDQQEKIITETDTMDHSQDPYWWVNSGAEFHIAHGQGSTILGDLPTTSIWREVYGANNPIDTDNGYRPQNIFRLLTRSTWLDSEQTAIVRVRHVAMSNSPNRNESNGILLFHRYQDDDTLYYAGIRVDGTAVIKKKYHGIYTTLTNPPLLQQATTSIYDRTQQPNFIPTNQWLGIKSQVINESDGSVHLTLWWDPTRAGVWEKVAEAMDIATATNTPITTEGYAGIRTDFMDVFFEEYSIIAL